MGGGELGEGMGVSVSRDRVSVRGRETALETTVVVAASFLTPCLYHWIGRPDLTSDRVRQIISENYSDTPDGLPGNDDSGAMSSWFAFHMMGLYPNAGQSYYLLYAPLIPEWTLQLSNGKTLHGIVKGKGAFGFVDSTVGRDVPTEASTSLYDGTGDSVRRLLTGDNQRVAQPTIGQRPCAILTVQRKGDIVFLLLNSLIRV